MTGIVPLPPSPYEKDFFGKKPNKEKPNGRTRKKLKKYSEHLTKHLCLRQKEIIKLKCGRTICSLGRFPKSQLTPNGLSAHQIKPNTKDKLKKVKAGISPLHAKRQ